MNRIYLLASILLAIIVPLLQFNIFPYDAVQSTMEVITSQGSLLLGEANEMVETEKMSYYEVIYLIGLLISIGLLAFQLQMFHIEIRGSQIEKLGKYSIIRSNDSSSSSLFYYIFLNTDDQIQFQHEKAHVDLRHSWDRVIVAVITSLFWFNPILYILKYLIIENHEYAADERTLKRLDLSDYKYSKVIISAVKADKFSFQINNRFNSLTKN